MKIGRHQRTAVGCCTGPEGLSEAEKTQIAAEIGRQMQDALPRGYSGMLASGAEWEVWLPVAPVIDISDSWAELFG